ncbi:MAG: class I SAM-dependent methyltransferase [Pirellulaceae bacterium]
MLNPETWLLPAVVFLVGVLLVALYFWLALTEYSFLGSRFVRLSYDLMARWYEGKWKQPEYESPEQTQRLFMQPILSVAAEDPRSHVLDFACGTGRISLALLACPQFQGRITAYDFSGGMLARFREHLAELPEEAATRVEIVQQDLNEWKCDEPGSCQAATLLEAAELIKGFPALVGEISHALTPDGVFLTTRVGARFQWLFRGRGQSEADLRRLLEDNGFDRIEIHPWRNRYDVVVARKQAEI